MSEIYFKSTYIFTRKVLCEFSVFVATVPATGLGLGMLFRY